MNKVGMMSTGNKKKGSLVPRLRFPEFIEEGEWVEVQLSKIANPVSDKATDEDADAVLTLSAEHGVVAQGAYFGKKVAGDDIRRYIKIANNDFVYNDRTTKSYKYGTIKRLSLHDSGIVSPIYKCFRFNSEEIPLFWEWYFESGKHDAQLHSIINEGAKEGRFNISIQQFLSTLVHFPRKLEQQKIADCLSSLDERITAEVNKLHAFRVHKKGLLKQLFPAEGETLPQLRFPEFRDAGEWEKSFLGESSTVTSGGTPNRAEKCFWNGNIPWITTSLIDFNVILDVNEYITEEGLNSSSAKLFPKGTVLMAMYGQGKTRGKVALSGIEAATNQACAAILLTKDLNETFIFQNLSSRYEEIRDLSNSGGQENLSIGLISKISFSYPRVVEQQHIADCLSSLDELITAQTQKIKLLKTHKKGLMQQLFPVIDEAQA